MEETLVEFGVPPADLNGEMTAAEAETFRGGMPGRAVILAPPAFLRSRKCLVARHLDHARPPRPKNIADGMAMPLTEMQMYG